MVAGHYLMCRSWTPEFKPEKDVSRRQAVWARIPELPIEYYDKETLWEVGDTIGKTLRVDIHSIKEKVGTPGLSETERGQFVRIYVEIDLDKTLLPKVRVRKSLYKVEYEGLPLICLNVGNTDTVRRRVH